MSAKAIIMALTTITRTLAGWSHRIFYQATVIVINNDGSDNTDNEDIIFMINMLSVNKF